MKLNNHLRRNIFIPITLTLCAILFLIACGRTTETNRNEDNDTVQLILDWTPNTNHTGLYVAQEKGYFNEAGVKVDIVRPPEGSTTELVGSGHAQFGISFQDTLAPKLAGGLPVTAVATIIEHNTSGILSKKEADITSPKALAGHRYGTWNDPIEQGMLKEIMTKDNANFDQVTLVPNQDDNSVVGLANNMFDAAWIYYAWDGIMAEYQHIDTNFFYLKDYSEDLDFYSPVIIANNDYLKTHQQQATAVMTAIKKGYQYAIAHPEEAADILIQHAPELKDQKDFVIASQKWISAQYTDSPEHWGHIDETRWNRFYQWLWDNKLTDKNLTELSAFSNAYLGE